MKKSRSTFSINSIVKRIVSLLVVATILSGALPMTEMGGAVSDMFGLLMRASAADGYETGEDTDPRFQRGDDGKTVEFSIELFADYSRQCNKFPVYHQSDCVVISTTGTNVSYLEGFESIGRHPEVPFKGSIEFKSNDNDVITIDVPLFDNVYDTVSINNGNVLQLTRFNKTNNSESKLMPLLAKKVVHDDENGDAEQTEWNISVVPYQGDSDNRRIDSFAGLIGEMDTNASLRLNVEIDAIGSQNNSIAIEGNTDVGIACGTMGEGSELSVAVSIKGGAQGGFFTKITTTDGNVGAYVGTLKNGSKFTLTSASGTDLLSASAEISTSAAGTNGGYAGGLVGKNESGSIKLADSKVSVTQTISGAEGAGGVYGYYKPANDDTAFALSAYDINFKLAGRGSLGGLFGVLKSEYDYEISGENATSVTSEHVTTTGTNYGGLIGRYDTDNKELTLTVRAVKTVTKEYSGALSGYYGGGIGVVNGTAYVVFKGFTAEASTPGVITFGGAVADAGKAFIAVDGITVTVTNYRGGGVVGRLGNGVLKLSGNIDLSGALPNSDNNSADFYRHGQLVGYRDSALIYAENWTFLRSGREADNVGSWGDVIVFGDKLQKDGVLTENADHTVMVKTPDTANINNVAEFAKVALGLQLDYGNNDFVSGTAIAENAVLTFGSEASIDLTGTGLKGLTRDNAESDNINASKCVYRGTVNGNRATVILDIRNIGEEPIYRHIYNGLFGIASGATVNDLTFDGTVNVKANRGYMYIGAAAARATGAFNAKKITGKTVFTVNGGSTVYLGGLLGEASTGIGNITIDGENSFTVNITGGNTPSDSCFGGVIGRINHSSNAQTQWNISGVTLSGKITNTVAKNTQKIGGLIAEISPYSYNVNAAPSFASRKLTLSDISIKDFAIDGKGGYNTSGGGLLGYSWLSTETELNGITINNSSIDYTQNSDTAGLVYNATGKMTVKSVAINGISVNEGTKNDVRSFGVLVNKGWYAGGDFYNTNNGTRQALYIDLPSGYVYSIENDKFSDVNIVNFDEILTYSAYYHQPANTSDRSVSEAGRGDGTVSDIMVNGQGIVSVYSENFKTNGTDQSGTYAPKTERGKTANPYSRYYYNLSAIAKNNPKSDAENLLMWGVNQYACVNLKQYFENPFSSVYVNGGTITAGTYSMKNYSWYPIDVTGAVTVAGSFKLFNSEFETSEAKTDAVWLSLTVGADATQHFMMQNGMFHDVTGALSVGAVVLQGNVGATSLGSGALVCGIVKGSANGEASVDLRNGSVSLDGVYVHNIASFSGYAPLLINKADDYSRLTIYHVDNTEAYNTNNRYNAATSLCGNIGQSTDARNINIEFSDIALDARKNESAPSEIENTRYNTTRSIFTKATLLNRFTYSSGSNGVYNYDYSEDWGTDAPHRVTYGSEISDRTVRNQYYGEEFWYINQDHDTGYYTKYSSGEKQGNAEEHNLDFSAFLPYVAEASAKDNVSTEKHYQLKVNHAAATLSGCGTYNDPYLITDGDFETVASILSGLTTGKIILPLNANGQEYSDTNLLNTKWDSYGHAEYTWNATANKWQKTSGTGGYSREAVRKYLAGAYYKLNGDITLSSDFIGLGSVSTTVNDDKGAIFRGVIIGNGYTITNQSNFPLIRTSYGSVVKDVAIVVNSDITKTQNDRTAFAENNACEQYGAVIGQILGGDNIIDGVTVRFAAGKTVTLSGTCAQLIPVGGYVGVVVNGALIFRGMETTGNYLRGTSAITGIPSDSTIVTNGTETNLIEESNKKWLYVNPIIGRVLNGYAVTEATEYRPFEDGTRTYIDGTVTEWPAGAVTMRNGNKNYSIADIDAKLASSDNSSKKLSVDSFSKSNGDIYKGTITIPNAQAFFILGGLSQTLGCSSDYKGNLSNVQSSGIGGYKPYGDYKRTHLAQYDSVGKEGIVNNEPDYTLSLMDSDIQSTLVPYIICNYTNKDVTLGKYMVFTAVHSNQVFDIVFKQSNEVLYLPDGFRGIGALGLISSSNDFVESNKRDSTITLMKFDGNGNTIDMNMHYSYYLYTFDSYYPSGNGGSGGFGSMGFGLFNMLRQNRKDANVLSYDLTDDKYKIGNLTLKGNVVGEYIDQSTGTNPSYTGGDRQGLNSVNHNEVFAVGGLAGYFNNFGSSVNNINIDNLKLDNLHVSGPKTTGGIAGYGGRSDQNSLNIRNVTSNGLVVESGLYAGGLIGNITYTKINVENCKICFDRVTDDVAGRNWNNAAGGLFGKITAANSYAVTISNVTLGNMDNDSYVGYKNEKNYQNADGTENNDVHNTISGGMIGDNAARNLYIYNCNIYRVNVKGHRAGGVIGQEDSGNSETAVYNTNLVGYNKENYIDGNSSNDRATGGIFGCVKSTSNKHIISGCKVENYTISSWESVGGFVGWSDKAPFYIYNSYLGDCLIKANRTAGAIGGLINQPLYGYNIVTDNVDFSDYSGTDTPPSNCGTLAGSLANNITIKVVGFNRQGIIPNIKYDDVKDSLPLRMVGNKADTDSTRYGTGGYVIFADYNGKGLTESTAGKTFSGFNSENNVRDYFGNTVTDNYPYVTSSPYIVLNDAQFLTGDGISPAAYQAITADLEAGTSNRRYTTAKNAVGSYSLPGIASQMSGAKAEFGEAYQGEDFPLLIIEDTTNANTTDLINNYLRLLTNTGYEFSANKYNSVSDESSLEFKVDRATYAYQNGVFVKQDTDPTLQHNGTTGQFSMTADNIDSNQDIPQFTLLDVQFFDPSDTSKTNRKVAYHLYVPVYTRRIVQFRFDAKIASGSDYYSTPYTNAVLFENLGTPVTLRLSYTYNVRSAEEWIAALNGGESVMGNYYKSIRLQNQTGTWKDGTKFALVDSSSGGKAYYLNNYNGGTGNYTLSFDNFADDAGKAFEPIPLYKLLNVKIEKADDNSGALVRTTDNTAATVSDGENWYRPKTEDDADEDTYNVTSVSTDEPEVYYLTVFTPPADSNEFVYHFGFTSEDKLTNKTDVNMPACKISGSSVKLDLYTGDLYSNELLTLSVVSNELDESNLSDKNNSLTVTMKAKIELTENAKNQGIAGNLHTASNATIYQTFLMTYDMVDEDKNQKIGVQPESNPAIGVISYVINNEEKGYSINKTLNHIEFANEVNLKEYLEDGMTAGYAEITMTAKLEYEETSLAYQFPTKGENEDSSVGTRVIGYSKIASNVNTAAYSTVFDRREDSTLYHCNDVSSASLIYSLDFTNAKTGKDPAGPYNDLGINAYERTESIADIYTVARYDASKLNETGDYFELTFRLYTKHDAYSNGLEIGKYMPSVKILDKNGSNMLADGYGDASVVYKNKDETRYTLRVDKSLLETDGDNIYLIPIEVTVYTGDELFKNDGLMYSNYKISLNAALYDALDGGYPNDRSTVEDYLIYTNAKMDSSMQQ